MHNLESYFVLNSVFAPGCLAFDRATFENNCMKANKDRHILSVVQIFGSDSSFWQYKVCAGSLEKTRQMTVGLDFNAHLEHAVLAFENNCVK